MEVNSIELTCEEAGWERRASKNILRLSRERENDGGADDGDINISLSRLKGDYEYGDQDLNVTKLSVWYEKDHNPVSSCRGSRVLV